MGLLDRIWHKTFRRPYNLSATEWGYGSSTVVLIHGIAARGEVWKPLLKYIDPTKYRVIIPDLLGFGTSPKPDWPKYSVDDHAKALLALLKKYRMREPIVVIGHSMGCLIATHLASFQTHIAIRRIVLYEPPLLGEMPEYPRHGRRSMRYRAAFEFIASHPQLAHVEARLLWRIARKLWGTHLSEQEWLPFERSLHNTILDQRAYDELRIIGVKTDIVYGRLDLVVIRRGIERIFSSNTNIHLHLVTDFHGISSRSGKYLGRLIDS